MEMVTSTYSLQLIQGAVWRFDWREDDTGFNGGVIADMNTSSTSRYRGTDVFM